MGWLGGGIHGGVGGGNNNSSISSSSGSNDFVMYLRNEAFGGCPNVFNFLR